MRQLKVFFAGRVTPFSAYLPPSWRDDLTWQINQSLKNVRVQDCSHVYSRNNVLLHNDLPIGVMFSQVCYYIQRCDALVVNLSDDISVGGSQEIFIAKYFGIPVIGIARRGGKFNKLNYQLGGKTYWNWLHPFVGGLCDLVVQDADELAAALDDFDAIPKGGLGTIHSAVEYYQRNAAALDTTVNRILSNGTAHPSDYKQKLRVYFAGKMGKASGFSETAWRDELSALVSQKSHYRSVNLDFLEVSHSVVNESDPKLIFGRDAYLIRSADIVVVNLSDDISVGGSVEMMLAKLYQRPLIGIARRGGKFVGSHQDLLGRELQDYVNPFVRATCDWLIHEPDQLPATFDQVFGAPVKSHHLVPDASAWYKKHLLSIDKTAQLIFAM